MFSPPVAATIAVTGGSSFDVPPPPRMPPGRGRGRGRGGGGRGGRPVGAKNYKNGLLVDIIDELRPFGNNMWELVAQRYKEGSGEDVLRDVKDIKDHWVKKLCNNFKKPTGRTGDAGDRINRCIVIERNIQAQNEAGVMGASSGEEDGANEDADSSGLDDLSFSGRDNEDEDDGLDVGRTASTMPTAFSTAGSAFGTAGMAFGTGGGGLTTAESDLTESGSTKQKSSDARRPRSRSATPVITSVSGGKTKNSSNRDRASVTKSIQELTTVMSERMRGNSGNNNDGMTATMQMMQQSQMQMQMQLVEMNKQGKRSLKFLKVIAKGAKKKRKKGKIGKTNSSSSSSSSSSDSSSESGSYNDGSK